MNGKLIGVSINGERIDCQPDSVLFNRRHKIQITDTSKHTVTLPVEDYNELLQLKKEHSYMSTAIHEAILRCHSGKGYQEKNKNSVFDRIIEILENAKEPF